MRKIIENCEKIIQFTEKRRNLKTLIAAIAYGKHSMNQIKFDLNFY